MSPLAPAAVYYKLLGPAMTRAFRCLWMLEEIGANYELDQGFMPSSRKTTAQNPTGKVPILLEYASSSHADTSAVDAEPLFRLTESSAINTYLGQDTSLVPVDKHQRALYDATIAYLLTEVDAPLWLLAKHTTEPLTKRFGAMPECVAPSYSELARAHARLAPTLDPFLMGSQFTAADIVYSHCLEWQRSLDKSTLDGDYRNALMEYLAKCRERPAYQRANAIRRQSPPVTKSANL